MSAGSAAARSAGLALAAALLALGGCGGAAPGARPTAVVPTLQYRANPDNVPGYRSPCAGGQPNMNYNCPPAQN